MSNEDNKHDTNYINKNDTNNHDARKLHEWARHIERAVSWSHLDGTCTSLAQDVLGSHFTPSSYMCGSPWPHLPPFLLRPDFHRLLPLLCPDAPLSTTPTSTTLTPWKATCATPPRGVTTPTTSPTPSQVMSPTTRSSTSSSTPRVPSPTLHRHRTRTWTTLRSASCSPKHTENTPITAVRKVCPSVSRLCLSCSIEQGNVWEKEMSISQLVLVSRETRTVLSASFLKSPKLRKWSIEQWNLWEKVAQTHRL